MRFFFIILNCLIFSMTALANDNCLEQRYVFDVGSGSTKSKAYLVDKCAMNIVKHIGEYDRPVHYHNCIACSPDKRTITQQCLQDGYKAIKDIEAEYGIDCNKVKCAGVATAWYRDAHNGEDLLSIFKKDNIHILPISQYQEGELGFKTVAHSPIMSNEDQNNIISWDIGGGSMQLGTLHNNKIHIYEGDYGIIDFFHEVREHFPQIGNKNGEPLYFNKNELDQVLDYTAQHIGKKVLQDKILAKKLKQKNVKVIGIGRIMYLGIAYELEVPNPVKKEQLKKLVYEFADISKEEAKVKFPKLPDHFVMLVQQALIIVYSVMEYAGIDELYIVDSVMTDQIALDEKLWQ